MRSRWIWVSVLFALLAVINNPHFGLSRALQAAPARKADLRCPKCNAPVEASYRFCGECPTDLKRFPPVKPKPKPPTVVKGPKPPVVKPKPPTVVKGPKPSVVKPKPPTVNGTPKVPSFGALRVEVRGANNAHAEVSVGSQPIGVGPFATRSLPPGHYQVNVRAPGYRPGRADVVLTADQPTTVIITLERLAGSVLIEDTGVADEVELNGKTYRLTPLTIADVEPGEHRLVIRADGYKLFFQTVTVQDQQVTTVRPKLEPESATLMVQNSGVADEVFVDDRPYRSSPVTIPDLAPGMHRVTVRAAGYVDFRKVVVLEAGKTLRVQVRLVVAVGTIRVAGTGLQDLVVVGGSRRGASPCVVPDLQVGQYEVKVDAVGYRGFITSVRVTEGETTVVIPRLEPLPAVLSIQFAGDGTTTKGDRPHRLDAKVKLDGKYVLQTTNARGKTFSIELKPGKHLLEIEPYCSKYSKEYVWRSYTKELTLTPGQALGYRATMIAHRENGKNVIEIKKFVERADVRPAAP